MLGKVDAMVRGGARAVERVLYRLLTPDQGLCVPLPAGTRWASWAVLMINAMVAVWMIVMGERLDHASTITSIITLGGRHELVLTLAVIGFALLAVLATVTRGFADAAPLQRNVLALAGVVSGVAVAGLLSVAAVAVFALVVLVVLASAWRPSPRIHLTQRRR